MAYNTLLLVSGFLALFQTSAAMEKLVLNYDGVYGSNIKEITFEGDLITNTDGPPTFTAHKSNVTVRFPDETAFTLNKEEHEIASYMFYYLNDETIQQYSAKLLNSSGEPGKSYSPIHVSYVKPTFTVTLK